MKIELNITHEVESIEQAHNMQQLMRTFGFIIKDSDIIEIECDVCGTFMISDTGKFDSIMWCPKCRSEFNE